MATTQEQARLSTVGGRVYWTENTTRIWLNNGRMLDMGFRPYQHARQVAETFGFRFIVDRSAARNRS